MKQILGIDIGSNTSSIVVLNHADDIVYTSYLFHSGQIIETIEKQLSGIDLESIDGIAYTSSCPSIFKTGLKTDTRVSFITAAKHFYTNPEALLIIGGEKFGLVRFGEDGEYLNYRSNTSCASGTGSFLDQQLHRLNLGNISHLGELSLASSGNYPKIASRCSVFAKTDLIHAQQEGYNLSEICDGLCYGLAKNVIDAVFDESAISKIVLAGGVSLNTGVIKHIRQITGAELIIDKYANFYGAIGAALLFREEQMEKLSKINSLEDIIFYRKKEKKYHNPPLELKLSEYPDFSALEDYEYTSPKYKEIGPVEVALYEEIRESEITEVYIGIDIGSTSTKAVLLDFEKRVLAGFYTRTSGRPLAAIQTLFEAIDMLQESRRHSFIIRGSGTTGSGRKLIGKIINSDVVLDEITAHARAAWELDPETDTIIEIGGQDSKFTVMRDGIVTLSIMNNVCAAGTGSFIEEQAKKLNCPLSEYAERASKNSSPLTSDRCTVFMERDLNHYMNEGYGKDELLASVLHSIRDNYLTKMTAKANIGNKIFFQGATAKNRALVASFEQKLQKPIMVSKFCHLTGALGVALELHDNHADHTSFRGLGLWKQNIPIRKEVCELCANQCKLKIAEIGNETEAYGFLCGRDYGTEKYVKSNNNTFDLLGKYKEVFSFSAKTKESAITIGLPVTLSLAEEKLFWQKFFDLLGIKTITSDKYTTAVKDGKKIADAEFCAPVAAAFGHVHYLKDKADYIFLPVYLEEGRDAKKSKAYCYYTQYVSSMMASTHEFHNKKKLLMPLVRSLKSLNHTISELCDMLHKIGFTHLNNKYVKSLYLQASEYYNERLQEWKNLYLTEKDDENLNIVLLGRPYTVLSKGMNNNIPEIIGKNGYNAFFMNMLPENIHSQNGKSLLVKKMFWKYAASILHVTEHVAQSKNIYPILITSFKCTPDSYAIEYFKEILDTHKKPYLILQLDEHDSIVGYETRIEAAIRSFKNHYEDRNTKKTAPLIEEMAIEGSQSGNPTGIQNDVNDIMQEYDIDPENFHKNHNDENETYDLSMIKTGETHKIKGKTILMPGWDLYVGKLIVSILKAYGKDAALISDTKESIQRSLNLNTGQCIPLNVITQNAYEYIVENNLNPANVTIWIPKGFLACNLPMFPHYMRKLLRKYDERMSEVTIYPGNLGFYDFSIKMGINVYLAYFFAGSIRKISCKIRPYETEKGKTDQVVEKSLELLHDAFLNHMPKEPVIIEIMKMFDSISIKKASRPKVAIFGDMYARDNDVFNQNLVQLIEDNGGEVLPTSYSEYVKIILKHLELRYYQEGRYSEYSYLRLLKFLVPILEGKFNKYFQKYIKNINPNNDELYKILNKHKLKLLQHGETVDNIFKIENLVKNYDDISLFVQTNPAYCCASLVTEAMSANIERMTGVPVVSIEYDGTGGSRNEDIIPYLKLKKQRLNTQKHNKVIPS